MDDLISRAAAIAAFDDESVDRYYGDVSPESVIRIIESIPAVDAVPVVHGNWIECYERSRHYYCSNCGKVQGIASIVMKYCPECGAKMAEHPWSGRYTDQSGAKYADNPTVWEGRA